MNGGEARRLELIQALRGIAAFVVVGFHARGSLGAIGERVFGSGYVGVDLFFAISGFIMVHTTCGRPTDARTFLTKRLIRIWPVYVLTTLAMVAARWDLTTYLASRAHLRALAKAFVFYPQARHGGPFYGFAPNEVGWTLNYEVLFYVVFAASLACGRARWLALAGIFAGLLVVVPLALGHGPVSLDPYVDHGLRPAVFELAANPLMWEFAAGVAIGLAYRSQLRMRGARPLAAVLTLLFAVQYITAFRSGYGITHMGGLLVALVAALVLADKVRPIRVPRVLTWLGDISFSLYLVHRVAQYAVARLCWGTRWQDQLDTPVFFLVSTALALALAQLSYIVLERGLTERLRRVLTAQAD